MEATFISKRTLNGIAEQRLYKLSKPLENYKYVVVSAVPTAFDTGEPETYIFGANKDFKIKDHMDLPGSFQGGMDHKKALRDAGYTIKEKTK